MPSLLLPFAPSLYKWMILYFLLCIIFLSAQISRLAPGLVIWDGQRVVAKPPRKDHPKTGGKPAGAPEPAAAGGSSGRTAADPARNEKNAPSDKGTKSGAKPLGPGKRPPPHGALGAPAPRVQAHVVSKEPAKAAVPRAEGLGVAGKTSAAPRTHASAKGSTVKATADAAPKVAADPEPAQATKRKPDGEDPASNKPVLKKKVKVDTPGERQETPADAKGVTGEPQAKKKKSKAAGTSASKSVSEFTVVEVKPSSSVTPSAPTPQLDVIGLGGESAWD